MAEVEAEAGSGLEPKAPTWAESLAMEKRLDALSQQIADLNKIVYPRRDGSPSAVEYPDLSGLSEADRAAESARLREQAWDETVKRGEANEELLRLGREYVRLASEMRTPDFSGMIEADRAAEAERLRKEALEKARRLQEAGDPEGRRREAEARILDFDPKQKGIYYNRLCFVNLASFDLDEESPHGPMRFTDDDAFEMNKPHMLCGGVNILSVKIASSDVGYPIRVYGTVIARDCIDKKCVYLYRRPRDRCQLINSKDTPLILTGPKRGLALLDAMYVEIDLKIKGRHGQDRELSKGVLFIKGTVHRSLKKCELQSNSLSTRLSTVDVMYAVAPIAVEATIAVEVLEGHFDGKITAHTSSIKKSIVLYDSKVPGDGHGVIQLKRPVVSVFVKDMLVIVAKTGDGESVRRIGFPPRMKGREEAVITVGVTMMRVKVSWSIMDPS
ncbi:uncharacterized protein [Miscanthus floridulus]|uniref:uncharacterized protein n=1 Tax=Miscanthus floridulus TaxID=154761 RepID=UPI00345ADF9F